MAEEGTFCVNADVVKKAGANASATSIAEAYTNFYIKQAEARICSEVRADLITNYSSINAIVKELLREAASNLAAIYAIEYDMSGFTSRIEAEDMINVLTYNYREVMKIATDQKTITWSDATTSLLTTGGVINATFTAGESVVNGDVCYLKSDGKVWKTDADASATSAGLLVMATGAVAADASGTFLVKGEHTVSAHGFSTAAELWLSTTAGTLTATAPSGSGDIVRLAGYAVDSDTIFFDPDKTYIEIA